MARSFQAVTYTDNQAGIYHDSHALELKVSASPRLINWRIDTHNRYIVVGTSEGVDLWDMDGGGFISVVTTSAVLPDYANMNNQNFWGTIGGESKCYDYTGALQHTPSYSLTESPVNVWSVPQSGGNLYCHRSFNPNPLFNPSVPRMTYFKSGKAYFREGYTEYQTLTPTPFTLTWPYQAGTLVSVDSNTKQFYNIKYSVDESFTYANVGTQNYFTTYGLQPTIGSEDFSLFFGQGYDASRFRRSIVQSAIPLKDKNGNPTTNQYGQSSIRGQAEYIYLTEALVHGSVAVYSKVPVYAQQQYTNGPFTTVFQITGKDVYQTIGLNDPYAPASWTITSKTLFGGYYWETVSGGLRKGSFFGNPTSIASRFGSAQGQWDSETNYLIGIYHGATPKLNVYNTATGAYNQYTHEVAATIPGADSSYRWADMGTGVYESKIYYTFTDATGQHIKRCAIDGSSIETLVTYPT